MNKVISFENEFNSIFTSLVNKNLNNSLLISGNKGIGKFYFIKKLIKDYINIKIDKNQVNHHLNLFENNYHPNVKVLKKELNEKTNKEINTITIDQIRELNNFFVETSLIDNFPKFVLIDSADDLNLSSSNALLKVLEEPKENTYFFLISHQPSSLLNTLKSRCLKINLNSHNFENFKKILISQDFTTNDELFDFLFDISNGSPGLYKEFDFDSILDTFDKLINTIIESNPFSDVNNSLVDLLSKFENEKLKKYLLLSKFILTVLYKIKLGVNIKNDYLSKNIINLENISNKISIDTINKKLDYLIKYENDLFNYNLDKKIFIINFFAEK